MLDPLKIVLLKLIFLLYFFPRTPGYLLEAKKPCGSRPAPSCSVSDISIHRVLSLGLKSTTGGQLHPKVPTAHCQPPFAVPQETGVKNIRIQLSVAYPHSPANDCTSANIIPGLCLSRVT